MTGSVFSPQASSGDKGLFAHAVSAKALLLNNDQWLEYVGHNLVRGRTVAVLATVDLQTVFHTQYDLAPYKIRHAQRQ